jgi:hypothetical protein
VKPAGLERRSALAAPAAASALVLAFVGLLLGLGPAAGVSAASPAAAPQPAQPAITSNDPILVESQSPWVMSGQDFQMRLKINAAHPATDKIQVQLFDRLTTRSSFDNALQGRVGASFRNYPSVVVPLHELQADPQGGYDVNIPVNPGGSSTPGGPGSFPAFYAVGDSGIFPLQVGIFSAAGIPEGRPVTTFLVYAAARGSASGLPKLNVSVVVPVRAAPAVGTHGEIQPLTASESVRMQQLVAALQAHQDVAVSLAVNPQTVDVMQTGSATDRSTLAALESLSRSASDEVLPATYAPVSIADLLASGLGGELSAQFGAGSATLGKMFGGQVDGSTWVLDGPVDQATVGAILSRGANHLILPDGDLSPLPAAARETTFALPTRLSGVTRGNGPAVYAADTQLTSDFNESGGPVLAADRLVAELAMIQMETPGITRGVAVVPPRRWSADPVFVNTLLAGLADHPLLQPVTASGLFTAVKLSDVERSLASPSGQSAGSGQSGAPGGGDQTVGAGLSGGALSPPAGSLAPDASAIRDARRRIQAFESILASDQQAGEQLGNALLVAESTDVTEAQRKAILNAVRAGSAGALHQVTLPGSSSITLTATRGQIPLTILSAGGLRAHVELRLSSSRLIFRPFIPPGGSCRVPTPTTEICELLLSGQNTTLKVPVEARSSGVFPLDVSLWTPGGALRLASDQNTVRSTAVSGVGVILIIVAVLSLAVWWVRDLRHGRRARRLVPPPDADEPELRLDDPVVREFFANPPPGYRGARPHGYGGSEARGDGRSEARGDGRSEHDQALP